MTKQVLDLPMDVNGAGAKTVREYLQQLLLVVWQEGESFNGKRPFGDSGWEHELYAPLIAAGLMHEDDHRTGDKLISKAILSIM